MKKLSFLAGMLTTALIGGLAVSALAATGAVTFNTSALQFNGAQISARGEDYALANGCLAPASITYTDEKGGGTTYLPVRRIGELMGVETGWDGATGSVTVKGAVKVPATPEAPLPADYSDWTAEEEKAYQEFKGLWRIDKGSSIYNDLVIWRGDYVGELDGNIHVEDGLYGELKKIGDRTISAYVIRMAKEILAQYPEEKLNFELYGEGNWSIAYTRYLVDGDADVGTPGV